MPRTFRFCVYAIAPKLIRSHFIFSHAQCNAQSQMALKATWREQLESMRGFRISTVCKRELVDPKEKWVWNNSRKSRMSVVQGERFL